MKPNAFTRDIVGLREESLSPTYGYYSYYGYYGYSAEKSAYQTGDKKWRLGTGQGL